MKVALIPLRISNTNNEDTRKSMVHWVEETSRTAKLLFFPQIEVFPRSSGEEWSGAALHVACDLTAGLARKRGVYVAGGFWMADATSHTSMLLFADRTGQFETRARVLNAEAAPTPAALISPLTTRIEKNTIGLCMSDDLFEPTFPAACRALAIDLLLVPVYLSFSRSEFEQAGELPPEIDELRAQAIVAARAAKTHLLLVNSLSLDEKEDFRQCGGAWAFGPEGELIARRALYDETPLEIIVPEKA